MPLEGLWERAVSTSRCVWERRQHWGSHRECFGMRSLGTTGPDLQQWWDHVTSSGCEIWFSVCSGSRVCGQGCQTCLCRAARPSVCAGPPAGCAHLLSVAASLAAESGTAPGQLSAARRGVGRLSGAGATAPLSSEAAAGSPLPVRCCFHE